MAVKLTPPSHQYHADFTDAAQLALTRLGECTRWEAHEPLQRSDNGETAASWSSWHDQLHERRGLLEGAVAALLAHPDYPYAHHRQWRDSITTTSSAVVAWAPVARRVLRDMSTARTMALVES